MLSEAKFGLLYGALAALGEKTYRRALSPFAVQMQSFLEEQRRHGKYPHDIKAFEEALRFFAECCVADRYYFEDYQQVKGVIDFGLPRLIKGDPSSDVFWACLQPLELDCSADAKSAEQAADYVADFLGRHPDIAEVFKGYLNPEQLSQH